MDFGTLWIRERIDNPHFPPRSQAQSGAHVHRAIAFTCYAEAPV